jgi:NAD(P)H-hydrate epimerase
VYAAGEGRGPLENAGLVIDGIAGTGLEGPLSGGALDLVLALNSLKRALVVSIDLPSGCGDKAGASWPVVEAQATLAIEPLKTALYKPALRKKAGRILPVGGIFPAPLIEKYREAQLWSWDDAAFLAEPPAPDGYKYSRGLVEIWAGSDGAAGAARIAARGAAAAGAGLVRLMTDPSLYPILAAGEGGIMVVPADGNTEPGGDPRFKSDVILAGPGWGQGRGRLALLERILEAAGRGIPILLDADALTLAQHRRFDGPVLLTPHAGELEKFSGIPREELLARPDALLPKLSGESGAVIAFKSHVIWIAAPDGRLAVVDGMIPALAAGGSGDLLAGLASGFAARARGGPVDWFPCAVAASSLLMAAGREGERSLGFADPLALASLAGRLAYKMPIL